MNVKCFLLSRFLAFLMRTEIKSKTEKKLAMSELQLATVAHVSFIVTRKKWVHAIAKFAFVTTIFIRSELIQCIRRSYAFVYGPSFSLEFRNWIMNFSEIISHFGEMQILRKMDKIITQVGTCQCFWNNKMLHIVQMNQVNCIENKIFTLFLRMVNFDCTTGINWFYICACVLHVTFTSYFQCFLLATIWRTAGFLISKFGVAQKKANNNKQTVLLVSTGQFCDCLCFVCWLRCGWRHNISLEANNFVVTRFATQFFVVSSFQARARVCAIVRIEFVMSLR